MRIVLFGWDMEMILDEEMGGFCDEEMDLLSSFFDGTSKFLGKFRPHLVIYSPVSIFNIFDDFPEENRVRT